MGRNKQLVTENAARLAEPGRTVCTEERHFYNPEAVTTEMCQATRCFPWPGENLQNINCSKASDSTQHSVKIVLLQNTNSKYLGPGGQK